VSQTPGDETPWAPPAPPGTQLSPAEPGRPAGSGAPVEPDPPGSWQAATSPYLPGPTSTYPPVPGPHPSPGPYPPAPGPYGPPGPYPPDPGAYPNGYGPTATTSTDGFAITALILSLIGVILPAVIFALLGLSRIRRNRSGGKGMAIAALIVSGGWAFLLLIGVIAFVALTASHGSTAVQATGSGLRSVRSVNVGDCIEGFSISSRIRTVHEVACTQPHNAEVIGEFGLTGGSYPGEKAIVDQAEARCPDLVPSDLGSLDPNTLHLYFLYPTPGYWALHDRTVHCVIGSDTPLTTAIGHT